MSFDTQVALVVDDSLSTLEIVSQVLRMELKFGSILTAPNGRQALHMIQTQKVDWVFSDIEMPEMSGLELLAAVREKGKTTPFFIMTSHTDKETFAKVLGAGATDFIAKPFNPGVFIQKVRRAAALLKKQTGQSGGGQSSAGKIMFSPETIYKAEVVNISTKECLLRTQPFPHGEKIYDTASLGLDLGVNKITTKGMLVRMEADLHDSSKKFMLATFFFPLLDETSLKAVEAFISNRT